jgi:hypothetical protein
MKKLFCLIAVLALTVVVSSCGGSKTIVADKASPIVLVVLETIPNTSTPDWVNNAADFWEENGNYFYRGISEGMTSIAAARRSAQAAAFTQIAEQVKAVIRVEFSRAMEATAYNDASGEYLKDVFFSVVDNLTISGAIVKESFAQRISETNKETKTSKIYYRAYSLAQISSQDYKKLVAGAFDKTGAQVQANQSAKELSEAVEKRFFEGQEK